MINRLRGGLILEEVVDSDARVTRAKCGVGRRVGADSRSRYVVRDRVLRAGKPSLVDSHLAEEVRAARSDITHFEQQIMGERVLCVQIELLHVRRPKIAVKQGSGERYAGNDCRELAGGR